MFPKWYETFAHILTPSICLCCDTYSPCTSSCKQAAWAHRCHKIATGLYSITSNTPHYVHSTASLPTLPRYVHSTVSLPTLPTMSTLQHHFQHSPLCTLYSITSNTPRYVHSMASLPTLPAMYTLLHHFQHSPLCTPYSITSNTLHYVHSTASLPTLSAM
jgi:hypothetical protein